MMGLGSTQTCMEKGQKEIGTNRSERNSIYQCEIASLVVVKHGAGCLRRGGGVVESSPSLEMLRAPRASAMPCCPAVGCSWHSVSGDCMKN